MKRDKKGSLTRELAVILVGLVAGTIMLCWFINTSFLEKYYMLNKQDSLIDGYDVINGASETGELNSSGFDVTFDNLCANGNIAVMIISSNRAIVRSSVNDNQVILMEFMNILFGDDRSQTEILQRSDNYVIQKQTDTRLSSEYMVLYGTLSNGNLILMRTAVESIRESAKISNQFLVYVGVLAIAISAIVTVFVSKRITTPISELTDISKRMTELDFDAKYVSKGHRKNEIDELGEHFNRLSCALESTISELKSANNELKQDIEKKTEIDEMRKEFLSNVSHELKTPMTSMKVLADSLLEQENVPVEMYQEFMGDIAKEIDRENKIITDLLSLVKMDKKGQTLNIESMNINNLLEQILKRLRPIAQQKNVEIVMESFRPVTAEIDETKFSLAISNLVENAIKYNRDNGWVHVSLNADHKFFYIKVEDSGIGIPEEDQAYIFERFYRVDKSHSREIGGTGLGLAIARNAVIVHRGSIKVYSAEGEGTTFTVRIPLIYAAS